MKIEQRLLNKITGWEVLGDENTEREKSQLIFVFWDAKILMEDTHYRELKNIYPLANIVFVSDSGSILNTHLYENTLTSTALYLEKSSVSVTSEKFVEKENAYEIWKRLWEKVPREDLNHIMIFCEWLWVNGSDLVRWVREKVPSNISLSWGLAWDGMRHIKTFVGVNDSTDGCDVVLACFYWKNLHIWCWTVGVSNTFWLKRTITKSDGNILHEIDGKPALDLYKLYLWDDAKNLPWNGFYFPLQITSPEHSVKLVRIILSIDEETKSVSFGWDVPEWYEATFLHTSVENLIDWAGTAAKSSTESIQNPDLAILISCVGRKAVLKQRIEEELENVRFILWDKPILSWFYSYGEIAPSWGKESCFLHNLTMTITSFKED